MHTPTFPLVLFLVGAATITTTQHIKCCTAFIPTPLSRAIHINHSRNLPITSTSSSSSKDENEQVQKRKLTEISPLKASMLTKNWQSLLAEVDQKVGIVPELGQTSVGVQRFGPELERRTLCKRQFEFFQSSTFGLALSDKAGGKKGMVMRELLPGLEINGVKRGVRCKVFACVSAPATMCLVECGNDNGDGEEEWWSVLSMIVNPTERSLPVIIASERAALDELRALATKLRVEATVFSTLAGSDSDLGICPDISSKGEEKDEVAWWHIVE